MDPKNQIRIGRLLELMKASQGLHAEAANYLKKTA